MTEPNIFWIPVENLPRLEEKIEKLNKTARKLDAEPITLMKGEKGFRTTRDPRSGIDRYDEFQAITVEGHAPKLNGWTFAARLEHSEGGTVLYKVPGVVDNLTQFQDADSSDCDHCGYTRRRKDTYVVAHEDGTLKQVGSNCLKDFLGHQTPQQAARYAEWLIDLENDLRNGGYNEMRAPTLFPAREYLAEVAREIDENGWVSRNDAWERYGDRREATADRAERNFFQRLMGEVGAYPIAEDYERANAAIEWAQGLSGDLNDYLHNLHTVLKVGTLRPTQFGIAASAISAHERTQEAERAKQLPSRLDEHVGAVGDRIEVQVTVVQLYENPSENWGMIHKHIMRDNQGRTLVWPATNGTKFDVGTTYRLQGTVKAHEDTKYGKQTVINRCKVVD